MTQYRLTSGTVTKLKDTFRRFTDASTRLGGGPPGSRLREHDWQWVYVDYEVPNFVGGPATRIYSGNVVRFNPSDTTHENLTAPYVAEIWIVNSNRVWASQGLTPGEYYLAQCCGAAEVVSGLTEGSEPEPVTEERLLYATVYHSPQWHGAIASLSDAGTVTANSVTRIEGWDEGSVREYPDDPPWVQSTGIFGRSRATDVYMAGAKVLLSGITWTGDPPAADPGYIAVSLKMAGGGAVVSRALIPISGQTQVSADIVWPVGCQLGGDDGIELWVETPAASEDVFALNAELFLMPMVQE